MDQVTEQRIAALEGKLDLLTTLTITMAGGLYERGAIGDAGWNRLYGAIEAIDKTTEEGWKLSRSLRQQLAAAGG